MFTRLCFLIICYYFVRAYFAYSLLHFFARSNKQQLATNTSTHEAHTNKQTRTLNTLQQQLAHTNTHAKKKTRRNKHNAWWQMQFSCWFTLIFDNWTIHKLPMHTYMYTDTHTHTYVWVYCPLFTLNFCLFRFGSAVYLLARLFSKYWEKINMRLGATIYLAPTSATILPLLLLFTTCLSFSASSLSAVALYLSLTPP